MKLALSSTSLRTIRPHEILETARRLGYQAAEIWSEHLWDYEADPAAVGRLAKEYGLPLSVHGPLRDLNVTSINEEIRRISRDQYRQALEEAAKMGAAAVVFHPGAVSSSQDVPEEFLGRNAEYFAELAREAERLGVRITMELMERRKKEVVVKPADGAKIVREVGSPNLGLTFDVAHLLYSGLPVETAGIEELIFHVHISGSTQEKTHVPLGEGIYDLKPALAQLRRFFQGIAAIESAKRGHEMEAATDNIKVYHRLMEEVAAAEAE